MAKEVDIIPRYSPTGDLAHIVDEYANDMNNKVNSLINLVEFTEGHSSFMPNMGVFKALSSIPFADNLGTVFGEISEKTSEFMNWNIEFDYSPDPRKPETIIVTMTIDNLPGKLAFNVEQERHLSTILNPKYLT